MIIINNPNNPTGAVYQKETLEKVCQLARENNILILADEIYNQLDYEKQYVSDVYKRQLLHIQKINHYDLETAMKRKSFESLTPIFPNEKISVGKNGKIAMRMIDLSLIHI